MTENDKVQFSAVTLLQQELEREQKKRTEAESFAKALAEEFRSCNDFEDVRKKFKDKIKEVAPQALVNIVDLANNAESESVRASMNKWILEWAMSDKIDSSNNEIANLIKKLQETPEPASDISVD